MPAIDILKTARVPFLLFLGSSTIIIVGYQTVNFYDCKVVPAGYKGIITVDVTDMDDNAVFGEYDYIARTFNLGLCVNVFTPSYYILSSDICTLNRACYRPNSGSYETVFTDDLGVACSKACQKFWSRTSQSTTIVTGTIALQIL